jgi:hypothetical protein
MEWMSTLDAWLFGLVFGCGVLEHFDSPLILIPGALSIGESRFNCLNFFFAD